jgi:hypothetical protein
MFRCEPIFVVCGQTIAGMQVAGRVSHMPWRAEILNDDAGCMQGYTRRTGINTMTTIASKDDYHTTMATSLGVEVDRAHA